MTHFSKSYRRFLDGATTIPVCFLSEEIRDWLVEDLGFLPENAYISNAAGDYVFVSVVKEDVVYTYTDSYYLEDEMKDRGFTIP
jgi:hypothetical protein